MFSCNWFYSWPVSSENVCNSCSFLSFIVIYCPDKYKTQKVCNEAIDDCLALIKFIIDWFVSSKMLVKFNTTLHDQMR